ncbi:MAG TPA: class I SAM-dependent methyltransferase [Roseiflexaceae bacterium]|nr:class I SAM-dependent methyltransferase [Roseiflexaceae bacterium]
MIDAEYRFQLRQADITALPFEAERFDVIIARVSYRNLY